MKKCVIFAGGVINDLSFINSEKLVKESDLIICADSGYVYAKKLDIVPNIILGDFDSYSGNFPDGAEIYRSIPEKDDTDTMLAVKTALSRGCNEITLYGALGKRFDHTFANIQTLIYAYENSCKMIVIDSENEITIQGAGECRYKNREGWYFSVFALTETVEIFKFSGVKYSLENFNLKISFPIGVSNEIEGEEAVLNIKNGLVLIVCSKM
ncbi:MAG: thiamine diphosphokinase [Ruminococcus sp.]|nr:thiamine diphosphokinase [Ruminococcus sp.]